MTVGSGAQGPGTDPLAEHTATWLLRWARTQLDGTNPPATLGPPPAGVRAVRASLVFLTAYNGRESRGFSGQGGTLIEAVMSAVGDALVAEPKIRRLQLDIVEGDPKPIVKPDQDGKLPDKAARDAWDRLTSWQDGLIVDREGDARWIMPAQILLQSMYRKDRETSAESPRDVLAGAMGGLGLRSTDWRNEAYDLWQFSTASWIEDATGERALPVVQGVIPVGEVDRDRMLAAAQAGGDFLIRIMQPDGGFVYTMDPWLAVQSRTAYNVVRHCGTAAALYELAAVTGDDRFLQTGNRAVDHLAGWYRPSSQPGLTYVIDKDGKAKLGAFGLALLALSRKLELAPDPNDRERALQIGRQIVAMQQADGSFDSYLPINGNEPAGSVSLYYPGEAMLGLARVAALGIDEGFLAAAHKGADFLISSRQGQTRLPPDAWLIQALEVLHQYDPKPSYVEHAMAISRSMLEAQYGSDAPPVYVGGFGNEPVRSTRTTARVEGIVAACRLGFRVGDARAAVYLAAIQKTVPHLLTMQYDLDNAFFLDDPAAVRGGMRGGLDDAEIRIDYVQHYISALLGIAGSIAPPPTGA
jgi:hypothetical protein